MPLHTGVALRPACTLSNFRGQTLQLGHAFPQGVADEAGGFFQVELLHDSRAVRLRRLHSQAQEGGDLTCFLAFGAGGPGARGGSKDRDARRRL